MAIEIGQKAPDFTLYDTEKKQITLSGYLGQNVLLLFFSPGLYPGLYRRTLCHQG